MEINKKLKNNLYIVLGAVFIAFFSYLYLFNLVRNKQGGDFLAAISNLKELETSQSNYSIYDKVLRETKEDREKLDSFVIGKNSVADLIEELEIMGKHANVEINKTLSVEKNPQKAKESIIKFNMRARGSLKDVYYFTFLVENMPYKLRIRRLAMATSNVGASAASLGVVSSSVSNTKAVSVGEIWSSEINFELLSYINE